LAAISASRSEWLAAGRNTLPRLAYTA
jgi:hypothetical protein